MGELKNVLDFGGLLISRFGEIPVHLGEVAQVFDSHKEIRTITRYNGDPCVSIEVRKNTDANTVNVARDIKKAAARLQKALPRGLTSDGPRVVFALHNHGEYPLHEKTCPADGTDPVTEARLAKHRPAVSARSSLIQNSFSKLPRKAPAGVSG